MSQLSPPPNQALLDCIVDEINAEGKISFARYMALALYHPQWGYYRTALQKFGPEGDFITAPELSPLFGECVARWCQAEMQALNRPACILEFGAGSGRLAATLLNTLDKLNALPDTYYILELSAELKARQLALIQSEAPALLDRVKWLMQLPETPFDGLVIANEVLDAMPVHKFQQKDALQEVFVTFKNNALAWTLGEPESAGLAEYVTGLDLDLPKGYCSEVNLSVEGWIASISDCLAQGAVLLIDYGFSRHVYYHPQRSQGTIMCHYRHRAHPDPLIHVGLQDITAHVDFTHVREAAETNGFEVTGYVNQAGFLIDWGLLDSVRAKQKMEVPDSVEQYKISQQVKKLTLPTEMGELFKVLTLVKQN